MGSNYKHRKRIACLDDSKRKRTVQNKMVEYFAFYSPHLNSQDEVSKFVNSCEKQMYPNNAAKVMMHQVQRLVSLSEDMQRIRPTSEPLTLLILIMCVENIAKLHDGYTGETYSKKYVTKFFNDFLSEADKNLLGNGFTNNNDEWLQPLSFDNVVKMLYKIRCDVVHESNYVDFSFYDGKTEVLEFVDPYVVIPHITLEDVRDVIIHGCINAIQDKV